MKYILYNQKSGHGNAKEIAERLAASASKDTAQIDILKIDDYTKFFESLGCDDEVVICGGDGTLNKFINNTDGIDIKCRVFYFPAGTGNDFSVDIGKENVEEPYQINEYIKNLPTVSVKGKEYKFINGVGYGIDGYCCEVGDKLKEEGSKNINYTSIAIKGLLLYYKPTNATVIVDGKEYYFKKVWLAPTMFGGHYGGGMMPTPGQSREGLSIMVFHGTGKIKSLIIFPSIFKGEHVKHKKNIEVLHGNEITVKFERPTALQIDGETVLDVTEYTARI